MTNSPEIEQTERVRNQGKPNGLFRKCMDEIRTSHTLGQTLRNAALAAGLLSDAKCYAELLGQFYLATNVLELRLQELLQRYSADETTKTSYKNILLQRIQKLGYEFRNDYELDLQALLGANWKTTLESWTTQPTKKYMERLETATEIELIAGVFILHGPLIIGGGAMLQPRVQKSFGKDATHVFTQVIGMSRGGRSARRREFIEVYDDLLVDLIDDGKDGDSSSTMASLEKDIVKVVGEFMALNNEMMMAVKQRAWWAKYIWSGVTLVVSAVALKFVPKHTKQDD